MIEYLLLSIYNVIGSKVTKRGAAMTEYAIILGFVAIVAIAVYGFKSANNQGFIADLQWYMLDISQWAHKYAESIAASIRN